MLSLASQPYPNMTNEEVYEFVTAGGTINLFKVKHAPITLYVEQHSMPSDWRLVCCSVVLQCSAYATLLAVRAFRTAHV